MLIKITTFKDRKKRPNRMTANRISQPYKVLFFPTHIFCLWKTFTQMAHCLFPNSHPEASKKPKSHFLPHATIIKII